MTALINLAMFNIDPNNLVEMNQKVAQCPWPYDPPAPPGSRLTQLKVRGDDGAFSDLQEEREYSIVTPTYLAEGGHGFMFNKWRTRDKLIGSLDMEVLQGVLASDSPITARVEGRVEIITDSIISAEAVHSAPPFLLIVAYLILVCV